MAVTVWAVRLDRPLTEEEQSRLTALLPPERRARLSKQPEKRREPLCAYLLLRYALGERGRLDGGDLPRMARADLGKPYFPDHPELQFNLSHTEGAVLLALADGEVGVDIERVRPVSPRMRQRLAAGESEGAFFRAWVRREARTKRTGRGVASMLRAETPLEAGECYQPLDDLFPGYAAGVAAEETDLPLSVQTVSLEDLLKCA